MRELEEDVETVRRIDLENVRRFEVAAAQRCAEAALLYRDLSKDLARAVTTACEILTVKIKEESGEGSRG